jgi:hypothetical protein
MVGARTTDSPTIEPQPIRPRPAASFLTADQLLAIYRAMMPTSTVFQWWRGHPPDG